MKYNFDEVITRRGSNSYKWDIPVSDNILPMWVADMDFRVAPCILDALRRRVDHGVFGYTKVPPAYYQALSDWFSSRHGWEINPDHVIYTSGVVPALSAIIKAFTHPGDGVIVQTPAYNCFFSSVRNNGCEVMENRLINVGGRFEIDFVALEALASDPRAKMMIICNPHNPVGRLWTEDELRRIAQICKDNGVVAVSDEIHCELTYQKPYVPYAVIAKDLEMPSIVCVSPSKAFNIAGLQIANIIATDDEQRRCIDRAININEVCDVNPFGVVALIAAYREGGEWLDALCGYLWDNYELVKNFFAENLPEYSIAQLEATYLLWIDISASGMDSDTFAQRLETQTGLMVSPGSIYGDSGNNHIRLNIACPRVRVQDGLSRLYGFVRSL